MKHNASKHPTNLSLSESDVEQLRNPSGSEDTFSDEESEIHYSKRVCKSMSKGKKLLQESKKEPGTATKNIEQR